MASGQGSNGQKPAYDAEVISQAESSEVHTALRRKLKNRHVAMIRYISLPAYRSIAPADPCFQYWWCHRDRSLLWNSTLSHEWWSHRITLGLHIHCNDMFGYDGLFLSPLIPGTHGLTSLHSSPSVK